MRKRKRGKRETYGDREERETISKRKRGKENGKNEGKTTEIMKEYERDERARNEE